MHARRLLQRLYHVADKSAFDGSHISAPGRNKQIANNTLTAFVNEEGVADKTSTFDRGVTRQNFGVDIAQDHLG